MSDALATDEKTRAGLTAPAPVHWKWVRLSAWAAGVAAATAAGSAVATIWLQSADKNARQTAVLSVVMICLAVLLGLTGIIGKRAELGERRVTADRAWRQQAERLLQVAPREGRLPRLSEIGDHELGVTATQYSAAGHAPYVARRLVDDRLQTAIAARGQRHPFVVVIGPQKAGKSRTAAHAVRAVFGADDPQVVVPGTGEASALLAALDPPLPIESPPAVLWLDDVTATELQHLTGPVLDELRRRAVIVATMASRRYYELRSGNDVTTTAGRALDTAVCLDLPFELTEFERATAQGMYPDEEMSASIGETLVGAQDLLARYRHGHDAPDGPGPAGCAVVRAAVDFRRAGITRRVTREELWGLFAVYLAGMYPNVDPSVERFDDGLEWAMEPVASRVSLLTRHAERDEPATYEVLDYVVGADDGGADTHPARPIPQSTWTELVALVPPDEAFDIGSAASLRGESAAAIVAYRRCCDDAGRDVAAAAALSLGMLLRVDDPDAASEAFQRAIDSKNSDAAASAALQLGTLLEERGDTRGANRSYRRVIKSGHPEWAPRATLRRGRLLEESDPAAARDAYQKVIESRHSDVAPAAAFSLGALLERSDPAGSLDAFQRSAGFGHADVSPKASVRLGTLMEQQGDRSAAISAYKQAIDSGHPEHASQGAIRLGLLLAPERASAHRAVRSALDETGGVTAPVTAGLRSTDTPPGTVIPDQELVKQLLDQMELKYVVDHDGDLAAPWAEFRTYFMFRGERDEQVFSVRTFYDRPHPIGEMSSLRDLIDNWNRRTLWPKVYTHLHDSGTIRLIGETQMLIGTGVSLEHFVSCTVSWVRASIEFDSWLVELLDTGARPGAHDESATDRMNGEGEGGRPGGRPGRPA